MAVRAIPGILRLCVFLLSLAAATAFAQPQPQAARVDASLLAVKVTAVQPEQGRLFTENAGTLVLTGDSILQVGDDELRGTEALNALKPGAMIRILDAEQRDGDRVARRIVLEAQ